ncbi:MAG: hypothetical protein ACYDHN_13335 [Solirubrobacteraceae bacterium]
MSLPLAITLIVLLDAALIGLLVFVMSRANRLTPHTSAAQAAAEQAPAMPAGQTQPARPTRESRRIGASSIPARS